MHVFVQLLLTSFVASAIVLAGFTVFARKLVGIVDAHYESGVPLPFADVLKRWTDNVRAAVPLPRYSWIAIGIAFASWTVPSLFNLVADKRLPAEAASLRNDFVYRYLRQNSDGLDGTGLACADLLTCTDGGEIAVRTSLALNDVKKISARLEAMPKSEIATRNDLQVKLGTALLIVGRDVSAPDYIGRAIDTLKSASNFISVKDSPEESASVLNKLGTALRIAGDRNKNVNSLREAIAIFDAAVQKVDRRSSPFLWAEITSNQAIALRALGERQNDPIVLKRAISGFRSALEVLTAQSDPTQNAVTTSELGAALFAYGTQTQDSASLADAAVAFRESFDVKTSSLTVAAPVATWSASRTSDTNPDNAVAESPR